MRNINHYGDNRGDLNTAILDKFSRAVTTINENHRILTRLPIDTFWTTNYDKCIEDALRQADRHHALVEQQVTVRRLDVDHGRHPHSTGLDDAPRLRRGVGLAERRP